MIEPGYGPAPAKGRTDTKKDEPVKGEKNNYSMNVEKISNGWIVSESWQTGEGNKQQYHNSKRYSATNPIEE